MTRRRALPEPDPEALVFVADSAIHGQGVFALRTIPKNTLIGQFEGVPTRQNGPHVLWFTDDDGREIGLRGTNLLRHVNHSSHPNAVFYGPDMTLWSRRRIREGEEITHDYGDGWAAVHDTTLVSTTEPAPQAALLPADAAAVPTRRLRKTRNELRQEKCLRCQSRCCKYVALSLNPPRTQADFDVLRWYLHHEQVQVYFDDSGEWVIQFETICAQLDASGRCKIYGQRPRLCRVYPNRRQYCSYEKVPYAWLFTSAAELDAHLEQQRSGKAGRRGPR